MTMEGCRILRICLLCLLLIATRLAIVAQNLEAILGFMAAFLGWFQVYFLLKEVKSTDKE